MGKKIHESVEDLEVQFYRVFLPDVHVTILHCVGYLSQEVKVNWNHFGTNIS